MEQILVAAKFRGLGIPEISTMDMGDIVDYISTYDSLLDPEPTNFATQLDWDKL